MVRPVVKKGNAIIYDPDAHREFVTGFRRRRQARRAKATHDAAVADKQARRDARRERRAFLRRTAARARGFSGDGSEDEAESVELGRKLQTGGDEENTKAMNEGDDVRTKTTTCDSPEISRSYPGKRDTFVTTTVTPFETFAETNFVSRLPNQRKSKHTSSSLCPPQPIDEFENSRQADNNLKSTNLPTMERNTVGDCKRKLTHSSGRKLSKMYRHSRIAKLRRNRKHHTS